MLQWYTGSFSSTTLFPGWVLPLLHNVTLRVLICLVVANLPVLGLLTLLLIYWQIDCNCWVKNGGLSVSVKKLTLVESHSHPTKGLLI